MPAKLLLAKCNTTYGSISLMTTMGMTTARKILPAFLFLAANEHFLQAMGYTLNEVVGKHHSMFAEREYKESEAYTIFWQQLSLGKAQVGEVKRIAKNGMAIYMNASYTPVYDQEKRVTKIIKFAQAVIKEEKVVLEEF